VLTRQVPLETHEAETLFAGNAEVISKACKGTIRKYLVHTYIELHISIFCLHLPWYC